MADDDAVPSPSPSGAVDAAGSSVTEAPVVEAAAASNTTASHDDQQLAESSSSAPDARVEQPPAAATTDGDDAPAPGPVAQQPMSKNQQKKLARAARAEATKMERRRKEREQRKAKRAEKRRLVRDEGADPVALGLVKKHKRRRLEYNDDPGTHGPADSSSALPPRVPFDASIVIDLSFDDKMTEKEIKSMTTQIAHVYNVNRGASRPVDVVYTPLNGRLGERMRTALLDRHKMWKGVRFMTVPLSGLWSSSSVDNQGSVPSTSTVATEAEAEAKLPSDGAAAAAVVSTTTIPSTGTINEGPSEGPVSEKNMHSPTQEGEDQVAAKGQPKMSKKRAGKQRAIEKDQVVYLTADSPNMLTELEEGQTYVIGGIVDKNRYKNLCYNIAKDLGIRHAALPIGQYIDMASRKVLTVNQCFEIMSNWLETKDWEKAFYQVIPKRKFEEASRSERRKERRNQSRQSMSAAGAGAGPGADDENGQEDGLDDGIDGRQGVASDSDDHPTPDNDNEDEDADENDDAGDTLDREHEEAVEREKFQGGKGPEEEVQEGEVQLADKDEDSGPAERTVVEGVQAESDEVEKPEP